MNKPLILHTAHYTGLPWEILKSVVPEWFEVKTLDELNYDCLVREAVNANYLLVSGRLPIDAGVLTAATHLKMIQRTGVGTEMLDVDAIKEVLQSGDFSKMDWTDEMDDDDIEAAQNVRGFHTLEFLLFKDGEARKYE